jgi:hypothetical protein
MAFIRHVIPLLVLAPTLVTAQEDAQRWSLGNGRFEVRGSGCTIAALAFDPAGNGAFGRNLLRRAYFEGVEAAVGSQVTHQGTEIRVTGCRVVVSSAVEVEPTPHPAKLEPGHTLGQSFRTTSGVFGQVSAHLPTWATADSSATLTLRRAGLAGEVVATRRLANIADNSWPELTFDPQPAGDYTLELSDVQGTVGWWSADRDLLPEGQAFADGKPVAGWDRGIRLTVRRPVGDASFSVRLRGAKLDLSVDATPIHGEQLPALPLRFITFWKDSGYDVSQKAAPFFRFFSPRQRYLPVEQLKRSGDIFHNGQLTFDAADWIEAEGTGNYDLRFAGRDVTLGWAMTEDELAMSFGVGTTPQPNGTHTALTLELLPREDSTPRDWPTFETPDSTLAADLNRFFYERAFSYPSPAGPAPWLEFSAITHVWSAGPQHDGQRAGVEGVVIDNAGYVCTWGADPGWPFPDPSKYDTRHGDTNARFILALWRNLCWTHDPRLLRAQAERARRAMDYQLRVLHGEDGLIVAPSKDATGKHQGLGDNYWDILPFGHLDAYANVLFYGSLPAMAEIEAMIEQAGGVETKSPARSPAAYRRLAEQTRRAYNASFWDEAQGRYIGCIDRDGERHDYGFTFVNLEAMAYGLASAEQARRIYHWMETEPTSTGKPDTYSAWVFAPRASTIHNPRWGAAAGAEPPPLVKPWWFFGWLGTPYGEQCQDGGAILYTSFYDRAWQRWQEILARYREPDRLCGGGPLTHGENPQRINPGSVGLDIPFPESGMVPTWFLYGLMGVDARLEGLHIAPRLPKGVPWLGLRNLSYRGLTLDLRVTPTSARLTSQTPGYRFVWERTFPPGQGVVFREPPPPVSGFPPLSSARDAAGAEWIWASLPAAENQSAYLRQTFDLPTKPSRAVLDLAADNSFVLFVNGQEAGRGEGWAQAVRVPIAPYLRKGRNAIAVRATNADGPAGLIVRGWAETGSRRIALNTSTAWRGSMIEAPGWTTAEFDDSSWGPAQSLGSPPVGPWGEVRWP